MIARRPPAILSTSPPSSSSIVFERRGNAHRIPPDGRACPCASPSHLARATHAPMRKCETRSPSRRVLGLDAVMIERKHVPESVPFRTGPRGRDQHYPVLVADPASCLTNDVSARNIAAFALHDLESPGGFLPEASSS